MSKTERILRLLKAMMDESSIETLGFGMRDDWDKGFHAASKEAHTEIKKILEEDV